MWTPTTRRIAVEIVRKPPDQVGCAVQTRRRWVVERFFAWGSAATG